MTSSAWQQLQTTLPHAPNALANCPPEQLLFLDSAIREAREREARALEVAIETSLKHIPFVLRGTVRKILFP